MKNAVTAGLASKINEAHAAAVEAAHSALLRAREAGTLLIEAKAALPHGAWAAWLAENITFSDRTARGYMRVASRWEELPENGNGVADLSFRGALKLLAEPKDEEPEEDLLLPTTDILRDELNDAARERLQHMRVGGKMLSALESFDALAADDFTDFEAVRGWFSEALAAAKQVPLDYGTKENRIIFVHLKRALDHVADSFKLCIAMEEDDERAIQAIARRHGRSDDFVRLMLTENRIAESQADMDAAREALTEIREHELYRELHPTFEAYLSARWPDAEPALAYLRETGGF